MKDEKQLIQDWQQQVKETYGNQAMLYQYLFETLDNFYYRYLETTTDKNLKTQELSPQKFGAISFESDMQQALKAPHLLAKPGIIELAKSVPRAQKPQVRYALWAEVTELSVEHGKLKLVAEINWGFPDFTSKEKWLQKKVDFSYQDLGAFRKQLALKLEEACELFN